MSRFLNIPALLKNFDQKKKEKALKEIKKIEKRYLDLIKDLALNYPKCFNLAKEKALFFEKIKNGEVYNPQFIYEQDKYHQKRLNALENFYKSISLKGDIFSLKKIYKDKIADLINIIHYHQNWGDAESTKHVIKSKGKVSFLLFLKAKNFCKKYKVKVLKSKKIGAKELGSNLREYLKNLTAEEIELKYTKGLASRVNINAREHVLEIKPNAEFTELDLERLKVHEIAVHFMRYFNAKKLETVVLEMGTASYLETEEGLAVYNEEKHGVLQNSQMFIYAGRVIASYYTLRKGFYDIFQILKNYGFSDKEAFSITFRVKRNISDSAELGGFTKDYVYFSGYHKIKKYAKKNDISDLFLGKFSLKELPKLKKYIKYIKERRLNHKL